MLCVSLVLAVLTAFAVPPDWAYLSYPDYRTLALLFCLMLIVAGFRSLGVFQRLGGWLLRRAGGFRGLSFALTLLCFFSSMVITNDVTLITFVPFTLLVTRGVSRKGSVLSLVVFETIAANLGSMATPIGNPQNLYIYTAYGLSGAEFVRIMLPLTAISYALLALCCLLLKRQPLSVPEHLRADGAARPATGPRALLQLNRRALMGAYALLAAVCLLALMRVLPKYACCIAVLLALALVSPGVLRRIDYALLATFAFFFIFVGNVGAIPAVSELLGRAISGRELALGAALSQVISNVPATFMLAPFASDIPALMRGVNLGGLGTPVASLASLIALKYYMCLPTSDMRRFMRMFLVLNFAFLFILLACTLVV